MRVKHLLMASALLSFMASCNDNVLDTVENNASQSVVEGAELLASGAKIVTDVDVESRMAYRGPFVEGDKMGLAWFTNTGNITGDQGSEWGTGLSDKNVYGNHMFFFNTEDDVWSTKSNVYAGAHFAYYPHLYQTESGEMKVVLANKQTTAKAEDDFMNQGFMLSPKELLTKDNINGETGELSIETKLYDVVNHMVFTVSPNEAMNKEAILANQPIVATSIQVYKESGIAQYFDDAVTVNPHGIPAKKTKEVAGKVVFDKAETDALFVNDKKQVVTNKVYSNSQTPNNALVYNAEQSKKATLSSTVDCKDVTCAAEQTLFINHFPLEAAIQSNQLKAVNENGTQYPVKFTVSTKFGHYEFYDIKGKTANKGLAEVLAYFGDSQYTTTASRVKRIAFDMSDAHYRADYQIDDVAEWKEAVKVANALYKLDNKAYATAEFNVNEDLTFTEGELVEANEVTITVKTTNSKKIIVSGGEVTLSDKNVKFNNNANVEVTSTGTLNVTNKAVIAGKVANGGIINVEEGATLDQLDNKVANDVVTEKESIGRVNVKYGSFVSLANSGDNGIVAYTLEETNYEPYKINTLMNMSAGSGQIQVKKASVNTVVVPANLTLDVRAEGEVLEGDPYLNKGAEPTFKNTDFTKLNIELNGGTLVDSKFVTKDTKYNDVATLGKTAVKNLIVTGANSVVKDINVNQGGKVTVKKGGELTVDAIKFQLKDETSKKTYNFQFAANLISLDNEGVINFAVNTQFNFGVTNKGHMEAKDAYKVRIKADQEFIQAPSSSTKGDIWPGSLSGDEETQGKTEVK